GNLLLTGTVLYHVDHKQIDLPLNIAMVSSILHFMHFDETVDAVLSTL
ncbi:27513_t:CDS:1, partial [Gigaspora margarita]